MRKIQNIQKPAPAPIEQAINALRLTSQACQLFQQQPATEQRRLLQVLVRRAAWQAGTFAHDSVRTARDSAAFEPEESRKRKGDRRFRVEFWELAPRRGRVSNFCGLSVGGGSGCLPADSTTYGCVSTSGETQIFTAAYF